MPDNLSVCDDTDVVVQALETMPHTINIKAAGTAMRFLTAYLSVREGEHVITGTERMKHRPIGVLVDAMRTLGADIRYVEEEGFPPTPHQRQDALGRTGLHPWRHKLPIRIRLAAHRSGA